MVTMATIPDHVPAELVLDIGHLFSPEFLADPYEYYPALHDRCPPLFYSPSSIGGGGGGWVTINHATAFHALRNAEYFQTGQVNVFPREEANWYHMIPQEIEPPEHRKYRNILDPMLTPVAVKRLADDIRGLANQLIDEIIDKGECEFTEEFARPLPVSVFLKLPKRPCALIARPLVTIRCWQTPWMPVASTPTVSAAKITCGHLIRSLNCNTQRVRITTVRTKNTLN